LLKTDNGKFDCMELYTINQDDILGNAPKRQNPEPIENRRETCENFLRNAHDAVNVVFSQLDKRLGLPSGTLAALSPLDKPSATSLRLLMSHPQTAPMENDRIVLGGHTDIGSITILFHVAGGLQILPAGSENVNENWRYIQPKLGCALVNIGDTLVEWTGGVLRSSLHRVVDPPGQQGSVTRLSLAYLIRPELQGSMHRLKSDGVIPPLAEGEEDESRSASEWAAWRAGQIIRGELKAQTTGGRLLKAM
jgi:isopenicillin N synthase-like dioxygenase